MTMRPKKARLPGHYTREDRWALPWFTPETYETVRDIVMDPKSLPFSYDQWKEAAENKHRDLYRRGFSPVKVVIDPDKFLAWCKGSGLDTNFDTLTQFCHAHLVGQRQNIPRGNIKDRY